MFQFLESSVHPLMNITCHKLHEQRAYDNASSKQHRKKWIDKCFYIHIRKSFEFVNKEMTIKFSHSNKDETMFSFSAHCNLQFACRK